MIMLLSDYVDRSASDNLSLFNRNLALSHPNENWKTFDEMKSITVYTNSKDRCSNPRVLISAPLNKL